MTLLNTKAVLPIPVLKIAKDWTDAIELDMLIIDDPPG